MLVYPNKNIIKFGSFNACVNFIKKLKNKKFFNDFKKYNNLHYDVLNGEKPLKIKIPSENKRIKIEFLFDEFEEDEYRIELTYTNKKNNDATITINKYYTYIIRDYGKYFMDYEYPNITLDTLEKEKNFTTLFKGCYQDVRNY